MMKKKNVRQEPSEKKERNEMFSLVFDWLYDAL